MKKLLVLSVLLMFLTAAVFAQETSQMNTATDGLFRTELDGAFDPVTARPGPVFGSLGGTYFFAGLTNFPDFNILDGTFSDTPFTLGYYSDEEDPFSVMAGIDVNVTNSGLSNGLVIDSETAKPVNGDTVNWIDQTTETNAKLTDWDINLTPYYLASAGDINFAVDMDIHYYERINNTAINTWAANNSTVTTSYYYDTAIANVTPAQTLDYSMTVTQTDPESQWYVNANFPIYMPTDDKNGLLITPFATFQITDESTTYSESYTAPAQAGAGTFNITERNNITDVYSYLSGGVSFQSISEGLGEHEDDQFIISGSINAGYGLPGVYVQDTYIQNYDYAGAGAALAAADITTWDTITTTREGELSGGLMIGAESSFYYDLADGVVAGIKPGGSLSASMGAANAGNYHDSQTVTVTRTDVDADGIIQDVGDTVQTQTDVFNGNGDGGTLNGTLAFTLPTALTYAPDGGRFSVYVSGTPRAQFSLNIVSDVSTYQTTTTTTNDATGTDTAPVTVSEATGTTTSTVLPGFDFDMATSAGFRFMITDNGSIDVSLNSNLSGTTLSTEVTFSLP